MRYRKNYLYYQKTIMTSSNIWMKYIAEEKQKRKKNKLFSLIQKIKSEIRYNIIEKNENFFFIKDFFHRIKERKIDKLMYIIALIWPIMTIPQAITIFQNQDASSMSIATWITYMFTSSSWLLYWIYKKEKPIIFSNTLWLIANWSVLLWVIIYK